MRPAKWDAHGDPAEAVARVAAARRNRLLRVYRRRLRWEDLEDCYSQATLELVARSRREEFASPTHLQNALEQKFLSRIEDRRRAIRGRSGIEAAMAHALPVDATQTGNADLEDRAAAVERQVLARTELRVVREVMADLTRDQQLVLASQVLVDLEPAEFCRRYDWSVEKYRKVAQRARIRLRALVDEYDRGERCRRLEPDILAMASGPVDAGAISSARRHIANCARCARAAREVELRTQSRATPVVAPLPVAATTLAAKTAGLWTAIRRVLSALRHPLSDPGASGVSAASGGVAGVGAVKVGIAVVCVAGAAGGYAVCSHLGVLAPLSSGPTPRASVATHHPRVKHVRSRPDKPKIAPRSSAAPVPTSYVMDAAPRRKHHRKATRTTAVAQIRREFSRPPAHGATVEHRASPPPSDGAQVAQIQTEFGFEK
jgi:DNA-directed RNA polymerase specialized sigma24 family protein